MVHISVIQSQLTKLGIHLSRWFNPEVKELEQILMDNEKIIAAAPGRYFSGLALLVATDQRLLLIDKRAFYLTVEDTRYDMISEINFSSRLYDVTVHIFTLNKQHNFTTVRYKKQLRDLTNYVQQRVWEVRQYQQDSNAPASPAVEAVQAQQRQPEPAPQSTVTNNYYRTEPESDDHSALYQIAQYRPHIHRHVGIAAMNGSRRYTPNAYTNHLVARSRSLAID